MTQRGWLVARATILGLMLMDMLGRYGFGHVLATDRPRQAGGEYTIPLAAKGGTVFMSAGDRALMGVLEGGAVVLAVAFFLVVWASRRRSRKVSA